MNTLIQFIRYTKIHVSQWWDVRTVVPVWFGISFSWFCASLIPAIVIYPEPSLVPIWGWCLMFLPAILGFAILLVWASVRVYQRAKEFLAGFTEYRDTHS